MFFMIDQLIQISDQVSDAPNHNDHRIKITELKIWQMHIERQQTAPHCYCMSIFRQALGSEASSTEEIIIKQPLMDRFR